MEISKYIGKQPQKKYFVEVGQVSIFYMHA
jgi:hypothetical protein